MPRFKDIKNAEDSNVLRLPPHSLPHSRSAPSPAIARAPNAHASSPSAAPLPLPCSSYPLVQDLLHAPVSRTPGSRARYFSQFTQIRCPARAFRL